MKSLIVHSDDFGFTGATNRGIILAFSQGILTSTSLLTNFDAFDAAVALAKSNQGLDIGVHINLLDGCPLTDISIIPSLVNENKEFVGSPYVLFAGIIMRKISLKEVEIELENQIEKAVRTGLDITHIDGHQHVHIFPPILKIILKLSKKFGIKKIRLPKEIILSNTNIPMPQLIYRHFVRWLIKLNCNMVKNLLESNGIGYTDYFTGIMNVGKLNKKALLEMLSNLPEGLTEIMCHPAIEDNELNELKYYWIRNHRFKDELQALTDKRTKILIGEMKIYLTNYREFRNTTQAEKENT